MIAGLAVEPFLRKINTILYNLIFMNILYIVSVTAHKMVVLTFSFPQLITIQLYQLVCFIDIIKIFNVLIVLHSVPILFLKLF
ncbi:hypothetical protein SDC9_101009 [bioreactor metagenome]|uniref:Uncharacterized protein n=1 Tax=bioreactor metagenome TaxID=1076179 RepID=A0A645ALW7_9ZZZZ